MKHMINLAFIAAISLTSMTASNTAEARKYNYDCERCGTVLKIESYQEPRSGTGGAVVGAIVGGVVGNQVGGGDGKKLATVAGAIGGGYAGKKIAESSEKTDYRVTVQMDPGYTKVVTQSSIGRMREGSRVKVRHGRASVY
jgi:outer membrane lipoprotein SlyB